MSDMYDEFDLVNGEEDMYEPVCEAPLPPVPPRSARLPPVPQAPVLDYEDLDEVKMAPTIPGIPWNTRTLPQDYPKRSKSPLPGVPQRGPPPIPDSSSRGPPRVPPPIQDTDGPSEDYEDLSGYEMGPEEEYEDLSGYEDKPQPPKVPPPSVKSPKGPPPPIQGPEEDYEDLTGYEDKPQPPKVFPPTQRPPPPPLPPTSETPNRAPIPVPEQPKKKNSWAGAPRMDFDQFRKKKSDSGNLDVNILSNMRKNLKKVDSQPQLESPKPSNPVSVPVRQAVTPKTPLKPSMPPKTPMQTGGPPKTPLKPLPPQKPQVQVKPLINKPANEKFPPKIGKVAAISDSDRRNNNTQENLSPTSTLSRKNSNATREKSGSNNSLHKISVMPPPVKVSPNCNVASKKTEDIPDGGYEVEEVYIDGADFRIFHQPYYYEIWDDETKNRIFNENTENGTFAIRKSKQRTNANSTVCHPYTMLVYFESRSYRLRIRLEDDKYAIGEKKEGEIMFQTIMDLVDHFTETPLMLIGAGQTTLKYSAKKL